MSSADEREKAIKLARTDFPKALKTARQVSHPWYRCQALAAVARFAPDGDVVRVANESVMAAGLGRDVYQRVAACVWPIRALLERHKVAQAKDLLAKSVQEVAKEPHPVSRMDALALLWRSAWPLPADDRREVLTSLLVACQLAQSWKAGREMRDAALIVASQDINQAQNMIDAMREGIYKRQAQKRLDEGETLVPRTFFLPDEHADNQCNRTL